MWTLSLIFLVFVLMSQVFWLQYFPSLLTHAKLPWLCHMVALWLCLWWDCWHFLFRKRVAQNMKFFKKGKRKKKSQIPMVLGIKMFSSVFFLASSSRLSCCFRNLQTPFILAYAISPLGWKSEHLAESVWFWTIRSWFNNIPNAFLLLVLCCSLSPLPMHSIHESPGHFQHTPASWCLPTSLK